MKNIVNTSKAPAAIGPYVQAVRTEGLLFTSGQLGIDPATGKLPEGVEAQTVQSLNNLKAILEEAGATFADVIKTTVFVKDLADFATVNALYQKAFGETFPARSCAVRGAPLKRRSWLPVWWTVLSVRCSRKICATMYR